MLVGEPDRIRTCDPLIKSQLLYHLSYGPHVTTYILAMFRIIKDERRAVCGGPSAYSPTVFCPLKPVPRLMFKAMINASKRWGQVHVIEFKPGQMRTLGE